MENKNENVKNEIKKEAAETSQENKLYLKRKKFKGSDGNEYWSYFLEGKVRNRDVRVDFAPKDKGGYEPLDIVVEVSEKPELVMTNETMTDNNGKETKYTAYRVCAIDPETKVPYECGVKPSRDSDKALLTMLLNQRKAVAK